MHSGLNVKKYVFSDETSSITLSPGPPTVDTSGYFHMFRSTNLRFFNNLAVVVRLVLYQASHNINGARVKLGFYPDRGSYI